MLRTLMIILAISLLSPAALAEEPKPYDKGDKVEVRWQGSWYDGNVLETRCGLYEIHYEGWDASWDEWVEPGRMRERTKGTPSGHPTPERGDKVEVRWQGYWYPAVVNVVKDGKYRIHYEGYGDSWDEWVGPDRIRPRVEKDKPKPRPTDAPKR